MYWDCLFGLIISLVIGHGVIQPLHCWLHDRIGIPKSKKRAVPPALTGLVERAVFFLLVASNMPGTTVSMIAWIGIKMAANWNRPVSTPLDAEVEARRARGAIAAAVLGLLGMGFALIGGLICRGAANSCVSAL